MHLPSSSFFILFTRARRWPHCWPMQICWSWRSAINWRLWGICVELPYWTSMSSKWLAWRRILEAAMDKRLTVKSGQTFFYFSNCQRKGNWNKSSLFQPWWRYCVVRRQSHFHIWMLLVLSRKRSSLHECPCGIPKWEAVFRPNSWG